ncbi:MAG: hypothetical protein NVS3B26_08610 [Mycobacteriales bacterium]
MAIPAFPGVQGVTTADEVSAYAQGVADPSRVLVTNGTTVTGSQSQGCSWSRVLTLTAAPSDATIPSGVSARIRVLALLASGRGLAAVQDGAGSTSRLVVLGSDQPAVGGYGRSDSGLPPQGVPAAFGVSPRGSTVYLALHSVTSEAGGPVPALPGPLSASAPPAAAGVLYASSDGGHSWVSRLSAGDPTSPLRDITALSVGADGAVFAIAGGALRVSRDAGSSFSVAGPPSLGVARSVTTSGDEVAVSGSGGTYASYDSGRSWAAVSPVAADHVALRPGDSKLAVVVAGQLELVDRSTGAVSAPQAVSRPGLLGADASSGASFHAISGHALLRYVDPVAAGGGALPPPPVAGDAPPTPPLPGVLLPAAVHLRLPRGGSTTVSYSLRLPDNPTPLNVFYLVDVSSTLTDYQSTLNSSIRAATVALTRHRVAVRAGIATLGTGPSKGKPPYPDVSATPNYHKPTLYHLLRSLGPVNAQFYSALGRVHTETLPSPNISGDANQDAEEGQLLALDQAVNPSGVLDPTAAAAGTPVYSVPGGQEAGFVHNPYQRNVIITATDEYFANPAGSPNKPDGSLDFDAVIRRLRAVDVAGIGLTIGTGSQEDGGSYHDLARVARGTGAVAPAGGIHCSPGEVIPAGQPIVCTDPANFAGLLTNVLSSLRDVQKLSVRPNGTATVISAINAPALAVVDVTKQQALPLQVTYSCAGVNPGLYSSGLRISLRGYDVGVGSATVDCTSQPGPPPALRPGPGTPGTVSTLPNVVPPAAPAVPVAAPQAQPQGQPQTQVQSQAQFQTVSAPALQQQRQLQLALALQAGQEQPDAAFANEPLAMVSRRRDDRAALGLLAAAMVACSGVGLARLRTAPRTARQFRR